jgi:hypothetical protein
MHPRRTLSNASGVGNGAERDRLQFDGVDVAASARALVTAALRLATPAACLLRTALLRCRLQLPIGLAHAERLRGRIG